MKVLVVRLSSFGDQIHVCPAVADLKRQRPDIEIHWLTQSEYTAVPQAHRSVSKVFTVPLTALKQHPLRFAVWHDFFNQIRHLRNERYDIAIDVHGVIKSALMTLFSGAKKRIGFGRNGLAEKISYWLYQAHFRYKPGMSSVTKLRQCFRWAFDLQEVDTKVDFGLTQQHVRLNQTEQTVLFVPFASQNRKMLPLSSWVSLAQILLDEHPSASIVISWGSDPEYQLAKDMAMQGHGLLTPCQRRFEAEELIQFLCGYSLVVGTDTGITHLANALGIPTVMIFNASNPERFFTPGSRYSLRLGSASGGPGQSELEAIVLDISKTVCRKIDA